MAFRTPEKLRENQRNPEDRVDAYVAERLNLQDKTARDLIALQSRIERTQNVA